ncbi:hypothetical protein ACFWM7_13445 [Streptomyces sp. NPDC058375]|uniref:hypothetical protein n=1 Tax=Streptomyces sp. NPDC058375 TaxID=3346467 RepID=UPI00364F767B
MTGLSAFPLPFHASRSPAFATPRTLRELQVEKWTLDGRILTAGVVQHDTDLPVLVVVTLEQPVPHL